LTDLQPDFVPPNCSFEIDDATLEWTYSPDYFDFIHIREMFGSVADWTKLLAQAYRCARPGGWVEIVEHSVRPVSDDGTVGPDHFFTFWGDTVIEAGKVFGKTFEIWKDAKSHMNDAGFEDVQEVYYKWPMNGWCKNDKKMYELGRWNQLRLHDGIEGMMMRLMTTALGVSQHAILGYINRCSQGQWDYERAQLHLAQMRKALKDYKTHAFLEG
jgi:hypothetical protein